MSAGVSSNRAWYCLDSSKGKSRYPLTLARYLLCVAKTRAGTPVASYPEERPMTDQRNDDSPDAAAGGQLFKPGWGPKLFLGVLVAVLVFFWWLLIWSGGVDPHHG
jgi:hypothetical protein